MIFENGNRGYQPKNNGKPVPKPKNMRPPTQWIKDPNCSNSKVTIINETNIYINNEKQGESK